MGAAKGKQAVTLLNGICHGFGCLFQGILLLVTNAL
jgi:hypothetical protein